MSLKTKLWGSAEDLFPASKYVALTGEVNAAITSNAAAAAEEEEEKEEEEEGFRKKKPTHFKLLSQILLTSGFTI